MRPHAGPFAKDEDNAAQEEEDSVDAPQGPEHGITGSQIAQGTQEKVAADRE